MNVLGLGFDFFKRDLGWLYNLPGLFETVEDLRRDLPDHALLDHREFPDPAGGPAGPSEHAVNQ